MCLNSSLEKVLNKRNQLDQTIKYINDLDISIPEVDLNIEEDLKVGSKRFKLSNEILLAIIVFSFGFVFPLAKLITSFFEGLGSIPTTIQRFSMVDVFLLSFLVYGSKISGSYDVVLGAGFYFLCVALTLSFARTSFGKEAVDG